MTIDTVKTALKKLSTNRRQLSPFYRYYSGDHALNFASRRFKNKFGARLQSLNDNLCKSVVNAPVNRLEIIGFAIEGNSNAGADLWKIWKKSRMPRIAKAVHREAFRTGRAYVIVWGDRDGKATISPQVSGNVAVFTDEETGEIKQAAKLWLDESSELYYLTLYYADRIEKYVTAKPTKSFPNEKAFVEREVAGEPWPLPNPFGRVPVFEFSATEKLSILADVIPLQDAVNKHFCDLMVAGEYNSVRQRYSTGIQFERDDETGKPIIPFTHDDQMWSTGESDAKFGEFSDANLEAFLKAKADARQEIARVTGVPAHYFQLETGDFPSGEALRTAESRFISMIQDAQLDFGETWADVMKFAAEIDKESLVPEGESIEVQWRDAAPVGEAELLSNALMKIQIGVSVEVALAELGYTDAEIAKMLKQTAEAKKTLAENLGAAFDGGIGVAADLGAVS